MKDKQFIGRYTVPVDHSWHEIPLTGPVLFVGNKTPGFVEFWAMVNCHEVEICNFKVFGTGEHMPKIDSSYNYVGTTIDNIGLVWHLIRKISNGEE
jgi:hypothetical protein